MSDTRPLILSFGSVNIDITARAERLPRPGETVHAESYAIGLGGKGSNQAAAAARLASALDLHVMLAGRVGADGFGAQARDGLAAFGVDLSLLRTDPDHPTGVALIGIDADAENSITVVGGANMAIDATDVAEATQALDHARVVLLQLEIPLATTLAIAQKARKADTRVVLDPAPAPGHGLPDLLWQSIDIITPNESETERLTGIYPENVDDAARAADAMQERGVPAVIVKMGARGVYWREGAQSGFVSPFRVDAIDTVAAGDCFNAGLATGLALGRPLGEAVRIAAAAGALATTRRGAAEAAPQWEEIQALIA